MNIPRSVSPKTLNPNQRPSEDPISKNISGKQ